MAAAPAVSPDGTQICFVVRREERGRLYVMAADGTGARRIAESLDVRDAPSWSPDGKWIAVVAAEGNGAPLFKVPVDGGAPVRLVGGVNIEPGLVARRALHPLLRHGRGPSHRAEGVTPDKQPVPAARDPRSRTSEQPLSIPAGRQGAGPDARASLRHQDFWLLDLATGRRRQLTDLRPGFDMKSFDVSPDGKQILFDRYRENSDIVLIDLPR